MNKTVGLDIAKLNLFFMKPNNLTSLRRISWVRLSWDGLMAVNWPFCIRSWSIHTVLHPLSSILHYSAMSLIDRALGKTLPCRAAPTSLKYDFNDASERLDNLFIDTST